MSRTFKDAPESRQVRGRSGHARRRNISVRALRREQPDLQKLSRAVIALAMAQDEADAQAADATSEADVAQSGQESSDDLD